jgi:hypothetical protein
MLCTALLPENRTSMFLQSPLSLIEAPRRVTSYSIAHDEAICHARRMLCA